jgi:chromate transporter
MSAVKSRPLGSVYEVAPLFLKLGTIAFGGPAAHIAMMQDEVVRRRQWMTHAEFLDLLGATNLIPGPNSTEMAIYIGHRRAGWPGLLVAGTCFIVPAMILVLVCSWAYVRFGKVPQVGGFLYGVKPVIIAVVFQALWGLGKSAVKNKLLGVVGAVAFVLACLGLNELLLLGAAGIFSGILPLLRRQSGKSLVIGFPFPAVKPLLAAAAPTAAAGLATAPFGLWPLFLFFLKVGSVLYGSGYVLLAFLRSGLVERFGWLSESQLLDAVAVGQVTPGPVFTTATFIGYVLGGAPGAVVATIGIFAPAFFFVAVSGPVVSRIRGSSFAGALLDGVNVTSLALMGAVTFQLTRAALVDWLTLILALAAALLLLRFKLNSAWLVAGGGIAGLIKVLVG